MKMETGIQRSDKARAVERSPENSVPDSATVESALNVYDEAMGCQVPQKRHV
jgi:hypothetical protein